MKKRPYSVPESAFLEDVYSSLICLSGGSIDNIVDYADGGDPFNSI